jgi:RNA polymerase sigma-70 factor (ECF subfamily)
MSMPSPELTTAAMADLPHAVDRLAAAWLPHVYRWCHRLGGPAVDAEDAAHEALLVMVRNLGRVSRAEDFPSWLFGVTRRVVANHRRRAWWTRWLPGASTERASASASPLESLESRQAVERVWAALEKLSDVQREVLVLCELEERSGPEVASLLGVPLGTVKSRLRLAKESFRAACGEDGADLGAAEVG